MDMVAPAEFFDELGGTMKRLYDDIRKGFDKKISMLEIARAYMEKLTKGIALKEITGNKARTTSFELPGGKIELTKAQVMSLYLLNKQPDAQEHIYTGGIKAAPIVARGEKGRRARIQKSFEVIKVTPEDVDKVIGIILLHFLGQSAALRIRHICPVKCVCHADGGIDNRVSTGKTL